MSARSILLALAAVLTTVAITPLHAAEPSAPASIIVAGPARAPISLSIEEIGSLTNSAGQCRISHRARYALGLV